MCSSICIFSWPLANRRSISPLISPCPARRRISPNLDALAWLRHREGMTTSPKRDPQAILSSLLDAARRAGADAADALFIEGVSSSVSYRLGKLEDVERAENNDLGLRVFVGQQIAFIS